MRMQGKIGIVTAAGSGMGRAGALRFAREGAAVGVADIDQAGVEAVVQEITAAGGRALALIGDLRTDDFARDIVRRTANAFGGSISCGTMSAIPARPRSRASTWPITSWRWTLTCAPCW
jgi:NAD(P)-dependent dehydrogenase (short-subunit alcohol dehydrogenase family)